MPAPSKISHAFKVSTLLYALFGGILALLIVVLGTSMYDAIAKRAEAERVASTTRAARAVFGALQKIRPERGSARAALTAKEPAGPALLGSLSELRAGSTPAYALVVEECSRIACGEGDIAGALRGAMAKVVTIRKDIDKDIGLPLAERRANLADNWQSTISEVIDLLERISAALTTRIRTSDPFIAEQMAVKEAGWIVRDRAGLERNLIAASINAKALPAETLVAMAEHQGQMNAAWRLVRDLTSREGAPAGVVAAVNDIEAVYFKQFAAQRKTIEKALVAGDASPVAGGEFLKLSNAVLEKLMSVPNAALDVTADYAEAKATRALNELVFQAGLLLLGVTLGGAGLLAVQRRVVQPLGTVTSAMLQVARGDLTGEVPFRDRTDEVGNLAGALAVFKRNAAETERMAAAERDEQTRKEARQKVIEDAVARFEKAAETTLETFAAAATDMRSTSESMTRTAQETNRQAAAVVAASEEASTNVQTVATASEELTASIAEIARQVAHSAQTSTKAVAEINQTETTVNGLADAAHRIGEVVQLINDIAAQTNLLALNATIEAARAGEAGRGFAVVASEVKALAGQTAKATDEIAAQVAAIQGSTGASVTAIRGIVGTIGEINEISTAIASAVEEQGAATREITRNTQEAARGTQDVSANIAGVGGGAEETGAAATRVLTSATALGQRAAELRADVNRFLAEIRAA